MVQLSYAAEPSRCEDGKCGVVGQIFGFTIDFVDKVNIFLVMDSAQMNNLDRYFLGDVVNCQVHQ